MNKPNITNSPAGARGTESGKVGLAILAWMLGVPGIIVLIILFAL